MLIHHSSGNFVVKPTEVQLFPASLQFRTRYSREIRDLKRPGKVGERQGGSYRAKAGNQEVPSDHASKFSISRY